jgi:hypothetical protein
METASRAVFYKGILTTLERVGKNKTGFAFFGK